MFNPDIYSEALTSVGASFFLKKNWGQTPITECSQSPDRIDLRPWSGRHATFVGRGDIAEEYPYYNSIQGEFIKKRLDIAQCQT